MESDLRDVTHGFLPGELSRGIWRCPESLSSEETWKAPAPPSSETAWKPTEFPTCDASWVLSWLLHAEASWVKDLLQQVHLQRPELFKVPDSPRGLGKRPKRSQSLLAMEGLQERCQEDALAASKEPPIVQFSSSMYFCEEDQPHVSCSVMRIGNSTSLAEVHYKTRDSTATAGVKYVTTEGKLSFKPGENVQSFEVPLINGESWDTTTEFIVELEREPAPMGCTLGRYLWMARVKMSDSDCFPSNKYRWMIDSKNIDKIPKWGLLSEYQKLNWKHPVVKRGTIKMYLCDLLHNLYFFSKLCMNVYLVDQILKGDVDKPMVPLFLVAASLVCPFGLMHILDFNRLTWKVGGASRATLQKSLIRKFLNYSEESRSRLEASDLVMAMTVHVPDVVENGYAKMIGLVKQAGKLGFLFLFEVTAPYMFEKKFNYIPFIFCCVCCLLLMSWMMVRRERTLRVEQIQQEKHANLVDQIDRVVTSFRMVADYNRRPFAVERNSKMVSEFNAASVQQSLVFKNNAYFPLWISIIAVAAYTVIGGKQHIDDPDDLTLGMFLAHLKVIKTVGDVMGSIYGQLMDMQSTHPALLSIVSLLNMDLDIRERRDINFQKHAQTVVMMKSHSHMIGDPADIAPLVLENIGYEYGGHKQFAQTILFPGRIQIEQGEFVSLMGPRGEGKATLLRLISEVILPNTDTGTFFVPAHLRAIHLPSGPLFFLATLYDNLIFGISDKSDKDADVLRVRKIVERLGLPDHVLKMINLDKHGEHIHARWWQALSFTQQCLLCLARGFIANPELLCAERPTMAFDKAQSLVVMSMFRDFCDRKGIEQDAKERHRRRPRTCIKTAARLTGMDLADKIYLVQKEGIQRVHRDEVSSSMLL